MFDPQLEKGHEYERGFKKFTGAQLGISDYIYLSRLWALCT
jgi:hypothetical protein